MSGGRSTLTLADIEGKAKNYRQARDLLGSRVQQLQELVQKITRDAEPLIRSALITAKAAEDELSAAIAGSPGLFKKPKSVVFHGVRVGLEKGKGKVTIADPARCVVLIKRHLEDQAELLIKTTEKPIKTAIAQLPAADLKRIGVELLDSGDAVLIRPVDSELERTLNALLKTESPAVESDEDES